MASIDEKMRDNFDEEYERHELLRDNATSIEEYEYHDNILTTLVEDRIIKKQPDIVHAIGPLVFVSFIAVSALILLITA